MKYEEEAISLRARISKCNGEAAEIGRELAKIKDDLEHGEWTQWVEEHLKVHMRTVQRYMSVAKFLDANPEINDKLSLLTDGSKELLAKNPDALKNVVPLLQTGKPVPHKVVAEKVAQSGVKRSSSKGAGRRGYERKSSAAKPKPSSEVEELFRDISTAIFESDIPQSRYNTRKILIEIDGCQFPLRQGLH